MGTDHSTLYAHVELSSCTSLIVWNYKMIKETKVVKILLNRKTSNTLVMSQTSALFHRILTNTFQVSFVIKKHWEIKKSYNYQYPFYKSIMMKLRNFPKDTMSVNGKTRVNMQNLHVQACDSGTGTENVFYLYRLEAQTTSSYDLIKSRLPHLQPQWSFRRQPGHHPFPSLPVHHLYVTRVERYIVHHLTLLWQHTWLTGPFPILLIAKLLRRAVSTLSTFLFPDAVGAELTWPVKLVSITLSLSVVLDGNSPPQESSSVAAPFLFPLFQKNTFLALLTFRWLLSQTRAL